VDPDTDARVRRSLEAYLRSEHLCRASQALCERSADLLAQSRALLDLSSPHTDSRKGCDSPR
jgi:hypothetical protein